MFIEINKNNSHYLIIRFIFSGNITLCRTYIVSSTTVKERTTGVSTIAAAMTIGVIIGPSKYNEINYAWATLNNLEYICIIKNSLRLIVITNWLIIKRYY